MILWGKQSRIRLYRAASRVLACAALFAGAIGTLRAQAAGSVAPVRVASIRQDRSGGNAMQIERGMAVTQVVNATAKQMIETAYGVEPDRISGGPAWVSQTRYDITYAGGELSSAGTSAALKQVLAERFHLALLQQGQQAAVYALVVAPSGRKFKESSLQAASPAGGALSQLNVGAEQGVLTVTGGVSALVDALRSEVDRPIVDRTGLTGVYSIAFHWTASGDSATLLSSELQQQLGLQLVPEQATLPACVIQRIGQPAEL